MRRFFGTLMVGDNAAIENLRDINADAEHVCYWG